MFTNKKRADIKHLFVLFSSMSLKHLNPQLNTMNPHSPYYLSALSRTVLLDNLSRNSCMCLKIYSIRVYFFCFHWSELIMRQLHQTTTMQCCPFCNGVPLIKFKVCIVFEHRLFTALYFPVFFFLNSIVELADRIARELDASAKRKT